MLDTIIKNAQSGDKEAVFHLIEKFKPILKKYTNKLNYEDAYFDLQLELLELILSIDLEKIRARNDGTLVNYISRSMYHVYCKLIEKDIEVKSEATSTDLLIEKQSKQLSTTLYAQSELWKLPEYPAGLLTKKEDRVIRLIYEMGYSAADVSREIKVSRQSVNQCKKRAEQKLKHYYEQISKL